MIHAKDLVKTFGETVAVDHASFHVSAGQVVGFLGPNGAGKTTTLRILTCFMPATSGTASVGGFDVHNDSLAVRRIIGYMPESMPLYGEMRVEEYLNYRAQLKGVSPRSARVKRVGEVIDRCWLPDSRRKLCGRLSKGYRQRVGLADALVHDPKILILDEPTVGLDPNQIRETRRLIKELSTRHTVLLSTHILPEVEMVCDHVVIIHRGRIVATGTPGELKARHGAGGGITVEADGPADRVEALLKAVAGVTSVKRRADSSRSLFTVEARHGVDVRPEISKHLAEKGVGVLELHRESVTLESVFVSLTLREG